MPLLPRAARLESSEPTMFGLSLDSIQDPGRVAALHSTGLLDSPPEATFDRLTRLASKLLHVPVSLISLVDTDRQFFKSTHGLPAPWSESRQTPLSHSFCQQVVIAKRALAVGDARQHPVLHGNGAVADLNVIAYLGVPLTAPGGEILGALCAIDGVPRVWKDDDVRSLTDLAESFMSELRLRAETAELLQTKARLSLQHDADLILADASSLADAIGPLLRVVVDSLGYDVGEFWVHDPAAGQLVRAAEWAPTPGGIRFSEASRTITFPPGRGLPGRVWAARKPIWLTEIVDDDHFMRMSQAAEAGLRSGLGLPVMANSDFFGVMTFLARDGLGLDDASRQVLTTLANQVGNFASRRKAEAEVARLSVYLGAVLDAATQVGIISADERGVITTFNSGAERLLEYDRSELIGQATLEVFHLESEIKEHAQTLSEEFAEPIRGLGAVVERARRGEHEEREWTYVRKDSSYLTVSLVVTAVRNAHGTITGYLGIAQDVSARRRAEARLREFQALVEHSRDFISMATLDGTVTYLNPAGCELVGLPNVRDAIGKGILEFLPKSEWAVAEQDAAPAIANQGSWSAEGLLEHFLTGDAIACDVNAFVVYDHDSRQPISVATIMRDSRARKRAEAILNDGRARLEGILESSLDGLMIIDHEGKVAEFNPASEALFNLTRADAIGRPFRGLVIPSERKDDDDPGLREFFESREGPVVGRRVEALGLRGDGARYPIDLAISQVRIEGPPVFIASLRDISERKLAENRLLESEQRFRSSFENAPIGMALVAPEGRFLQVNQALCGIVGYSEIELLANDFQHITHPDDLAADIEEVRHLLAGETRSYQMEKRYFHKQGHIVWVVLSVSLVRDTRGRPLHFVSQINDITPRKRAEEALRQANNELETRVQERTAELNDANATLRTSEQHFRQLANAMPQIVWTSRPDGSNDYCNDRWYEYTGLPRDDASFQGWKSIVHPDDIAKFVEPWKLSLRTGEPFESEMRFTDRTTNQYRWHLVRAIAIGNGEGEIERWFGTSTDIDDQKRAEEAVKEANRTVTEILENITDASFAVDSEWRFSYMNPRFEKQFGKRREDVLGQTIWEVFPRLVGTIAEENYRRVIGEQKPVCFETFSPYLQCWLEIRAYPTTHGMAAYMSDISDRKEVEDRRLRVQHELETRVEERTAELAKAKEAAEIASRVKGEFLANMSHEVRTPMAAVLGYAEMLLDSSLAKAERKHALQAIRRNGSHLLQIINDILDLSKIEAGRLVLELIDYSPGQLALEVVSVLKIHAREKRVALKIEIERPAPAPGGMDPTRVRQILMNLVSNAIKFSDAGGVVVVRLGQREDVEGERILHFEVEDRGIGMTSDQVGQLFKPFHQADTSTTRKFGGTGLGLSITRRLIEAMSGRITVRSEFGRGTCFSVEVPLAPTDMNRLAPGVAESQTLPALNPLREDQPDRQTLSGKILLAEDSLDNQRVLLYHLRRLGLDVESVGNGRLAVEKALASDFDLVVMDMQMPVLDGYRAAKELRFAGYRVPIIALTAHAMPEDREKCLAAGCSDYLSKPIDARSLAQTLSTYLSPYHEDLGSNTSFSTSIDCDNDDVIVSEFHREDDMASLIREYVAVLKDQVSTLRLFSSRGEVREIESLAHKIKGVGGMYGYPCLSEIASLIEQAAREGQGVDLLGELVEQLAELSSKIERGLERG